MKYKRNLLATWTIAFLSISGSGMFGSGIFGLHGIASAQAVVETPPETSAVAAQEETDAKVETANQEITVQEDMNRFMRIRRDRKQNAIGMETSVTRYVVKNKNDEIVTVDLIGVVHIGEKDYYESLNELFTQYDALLYELVAPEGTVIPKGGGDRGIGFNPIAALQKTMQGGLGLEFQLEHIDYTAENFVHADMTPEEFAESMKKNNESLFKMALKAIGQGMAKQAKGTESADAELIMAMFSDEPQKKIRQMLATQMLDMESGMVIFKGENGSTIINHRNTKALEVMMEQIDSGKKRIGIFYGAGHLPDMDKTLTKKMGMKRGGQTWYNAWDLADE